MANNNNNRYKTTTITIENNTMSFAYNYLFVSLWMMFVYDDDGVYTMSFPDTCLKW